MSIVQIKVLTEVAGFDSMYSTALEWNDSRLNNLN
jgi:hypothetical protein